jgi:methanogenic corrinoid protein MtbC1
MNHSAVTFNPFDYSDVPLYNIQAVSAATGVPAITLRSWERRYGVPRPQRDAKGYRLYSPRDIATVRWLHERVEQDVGISRAVNMLRVMSSGDLPPTEAGFDLDSLRQDLLEALSTLDEATVNQVLARALMATSVEGMAIDVIQPVLQEIGERWATGELSVTTEHIASNLLRTYLAQLIHLTPPPLRGMTVAVGCAPGESHDIGALMLALFLRRRGFAVLFAGASVEARSFAADALDRNFAAVCLSASTEPSTAAIREVIALLRPQYSGIIGYGGRVFIARPELRAGMPGAYLGDDAAQAAAGLEHRLVA